MTAARVVSAGILLHRTTGEGFEVWIGHMGGPFWARKDNRAWSMPKGLLDDGEDPLAAALREFAEEIGTAAPDADYLPLGEFPQRSGKVVVAFAAEADGFEPPTVTSNTFTLEWPRGSGVMREFPEIDRAEWMPIERARQKVVAGQVPVLDALVARLGLPTP